MSGRPVWSAATDDTSIVKGLVTAYMVMYISRYE